VELSGEVFHGPAEPVEFPDHEGDADAELLQRFRQARPMGLLKVCLTL
jgi:hypothetical protein